MSYDNLSSVSQNVLKYYQQLTGEERRIPFIFDDFHLYLFCHLRSRRVVIPLTGLLQKFWIYLEYEIVFYCQGLLYTFIFLC